MTEENYVEQPATEQTAQGQDAPSEVYEATDEQHGDDAVAADAEQSEAEASTDAANDAPLSAPAESGWAAD